MISFPANNFPDLFHFPPLTPADEKHALQEIERYEEVYSNAIRRLKEIRELKESPYTSPLSKQALGPRELAAQKEAKHVCLNIWK